ncbi:MAG TPA: SGNH/GDSL hydrolase family protein [Burkholderiaceae bacterium]|nr:SGNH/GDSL hydrolase family protein [Burkholderiaceae bacterium]
MTGTWLRRTMMTVACASLTLLAACGSGTIESALRPTRLVVFGDAMSDVGQAGARYTVNDGSTSTWIEQLALHYSITLTPSATGGLGYARGNARVTTKPDAAGNAATPTVKEQVDAFLAANTVGPNDLLVLHAGVSDMVAEMAAVTAGTQTEAQMVANVQQAGRDLGDQAIRLVTAGAKYVVVVNAYNVGRSPWATAINKASLLADANGKFNDAMKIKVEPYGTTMLYIDAAYYFNLVIANPGGYALTDTTKLSCTSVDAGNGIGTGAGQVNSLLCNTGTIAAGLDYSKQAFADSLYFTPVVNRLFGTHVFDKIRSRW